MQKKWYVRPWYEWLGWALWLAVTGVFLQSAIAGYFEVQPKAALISRLVTAFLVVFAAVVWGLRIARGNAPAASAPEKESAV